MQDLYKEITVFLAGNKQSLEIFGPQLNNPQENSYLDEKASALHQQIILFKQRYETLAKQFNEDQFNNDGIDTQANVLLQLRDNFEKKLPTPNNQTTKFNKVYVFMGMLVEKMTQGMLWLLTPVFELFESIYKNIKEYIQDPNTNIALDILKLIGIIIALPFLLIYFLCKEKEGEETFHLVLVGAIVWPIILSIVTVVAALYLTALSIVTVAYISALVIIGLVDAAVGLTHLISNLINWLADKYTTHQAEQQLEQELGSFIENLNENDLEKALFGQIQCLFLKDPVLSAYDSSVNPASQPGPVVNNEIFAAYVKFLLETIGNKNSQTEVTEASEVTLLMQLSLLNNAIIKFIEANTQQELNSAKIAVNSNIIPDPRYQTTFNKSEDKALQLQSFMPKPPINPEIDQGEILTSTRANLAACKDEKQVKTYVENLSDRDLSVHLTKYMNRMFFKPAPNEDLPQVRIPVDILEKMPTSHC